MGEIIYDGEEDGWICKILLGGDVDPLCCCGDGDGDCCGDGEGDGSTKDCVLVCSSISNLLLASSISLLISSNLRRASSISHCCRWVSSGGVIIDGVGVGFGSSGSVLGKGLMVGFSLAFGCWAGLGVVTGEGAGSEVSGV